MVSSILSISPLFQEREATRLTVAYRCCAVNTSLFLMRCLHYLFYPPSPSSIHKRAVGEEQLASNSSKSSLTAGGISGLRRKPPETLSNRTLTILGPALPQKYASPSSSLRLLLHALG